MSIADRWIAFVNAHDELAWKRERLAQLTGGSMMPTAIVNKPQPSELGGSDVIVSTRAADAAVRLKGRIAAAIADAIQDFQTATGLAVSDVDVAFADMTGAGDPLRRFVLTKVDVRIEF